MSANYDWKSVPMPENMKNFCERDKRGLPVPFVVLKDKEGNHHFKINDSHKTRICVFERLCTICGQIMNVNNRWLVGGIASAFDERGYYIDHPVHKECAEYALKVCPYLAVRNYNAKIDISKMEDYFKDQGVLLQNPTVDFDRLPFFVLIRPLNIVYAAPKNSPDDIKVKALGPYHEIEFWCDGQQIVLDDAIDKIKGTKWEKYTNSMYEQQCFQIKT